MTFSTLANDNLPGGAEEPESKAFQRVAVAPRLPDDTYDMPSERLGPGATLVDVLKWRAQHEPKRRAHTFLGRDDEEVHVTFAELDRRAQAIAARLQQMGAAGERVLLVYPTGLEFIAAFYGCLYAGAIAVPAYPPDPTRLSFSLPRLIAIVQDAQAAFALTTTGFLALLGTVLVRTKLAGPLSHLPIPDVLGGRALRDLAELDTRPLEKLKWISSERIRDAEASGLRPPTIAPETIAYLQYTSGSTATPRGVVVRHGNIVANLTMVARVTRVTTGSSSVGWLPLYHDLGLACYVMSSVFSGCTSVLMSPLDFLQSPIRWLRAITRYRTTHNAGPNFSYDLCVRRISEAERVGLDLRAWRQAGNGGEPVRADTMRRFIEAFGPRGFQATAFQPAYGMAEATVLVTGGRPEHTPPPIVRLSAEALRQNRVQLGDPANGAVIEVVGCGYTGEGHEVAIIHPETRRLAMADEVGEVWFRGPSVATGYWERSEQSRDTFAATVADTGEGPFLRTGDLGFVFEGQIFLTGRIKDMILVSGVNHYPQDIEHTVWSVDSALRAGCGAAFAIDGDDGERLVVVQELDRSRKSALDELAASIRERVYREHQIGLHALVFIEARSIPKTSSGKIQRSACRAQYLAGRLRVVYASTA